MQNDEIKEILDYISDRVIEKEKWNKVKDYIINLQGNNWGNEVKATNQKIKIKELEKRIVKLKDNITNLQQENDRLTNELNTCMIERNNFLSRIEKAVEKLKKIQENAIKYGAEHDVIICQELIDTLNSRSDE